MAYVRTAIAILVALAATAAIVAFVFGAGSASPASPASPDAGPVTGLVTAIPTAGATATPAVPSASAIPLAQLRLSIQRLGISLPLAPGDVQRDVIAGATPEGVALLFPGTPVPGSGGNSYIYAHARTGMFLSLWDVRLGDLVDVTAADGTRFRYVITQIAPRVDPADSTWLDQSGPERLTLQTSTGPTGGYPRFIAVAARLPQSGD